MGKEYAAIPGLPTDLAQLTFEQRYHGFVRAVKHLATVEEREVALSLVIWPEGPPTPTELEEAIREYQLRPKRAARRAQAVPA